MAIQWRRGIARVYLVFAVLVVAAVGGIGWFDYREPECLKVGDTVFYDAQTQSWRKQAYPLQSSDSAVIDRPGPWNGNLQRSDGTKMSACLPEKELTKNKLSNAVTYGFIVAGVLLVFGLLARWIISGFFPKGKSAQSV